MAQTQILMLQPEPDAFSERTMQQNATVAKALLWTLLRVQTENKKYRPDLWGICPRALSGHALATPMHESINQSINLFAKYDKEQV